MSDSGSLLSAIILGCVEGLTEFLPVSSTGHMILVGHLIEFTGPLAETFEICIQLGAILAVVALYPRRFTALLDFDGPGGRSISREPSFSGLTALVKLGLACAPAFVLGALFHKQIKELLFAPLPVAVALIFGGLVMIFVEQGRPAPAVARIEELSFRDAFITGVFQCAALWPGISRSGSMIVGGLLLGMERTVAAEFSFLVAVPIMAAATGYDLLKSHSLLSAEFVPVLSLGFAVAFITAIVGIKFLIGLLRRFTLVPFGVYRILLGAAVLFLLR